MLTDDILQLHSLQVIPDSLIRVQLRSVGRQLLQVDSLPGRAGQKSFDLMAAMDGVAIPDDQQLHRDVGGQVLEEAGRILAPEGTVLHSGVQPAMGGNATNHREMVPAEGCPEHRSPALGSIGLDHQGQQVAAALVYEDDGPAYLGGVVLDIEVALDNLGHPGLGPDVAAKAEVLWSLGQEFQQLEPLLVGQLGPPTGRFAMAQGLGSLAPGPAEPLADGPFGHAQGFGDAVLGPAFLEQLPSPQAASFPPVGCLLGIQCCHTSQYASPPPGCLVLSSRLSNSI